MASKSETGEIDDWDEQAAKAASFGDGDLTEKQIALMFGENLPAENTLPPAQVEAFPQLHTTSQPSHLGRYGSEFRDFGPSPPPMRQPHQPYLWGYGSEERSSGPSPPPMRQYPPVLSKKPSPLDAAIERTKRELDARLAQERKELLTEQNAAYAESLAADRSKEASKSVSPRETPGTSDSDADVSLPVVAPVMSLTPPGTPEPRLTREELRALRVKFFAKAKAPTS
jgi:hypothetical protein